MLTTIIGIAIGTFVGRLIFDIWKSRRKGDENDEKRQTGRTGENL